MNTTERKLRKTIRGIIKESLDLSEAEGEGGGDDSTPQQKMIAKFSGLPWAATLTQQINTTNEFSELMTLFINFFAAMNTMDAPQEKTAIRKVMTAYLKDNPEETPGDPTTASIRPGDPDETASFTQDIEIPENRTVKENRTNIKKNLLKQVRKRKNA